MLTDSEIKFFNDKNLELPKRCSECRKENKAKYRRNRKLTNNNAGKDNNKIKYDKENNTGSRPTVIVHFYPPFLLSDRQHF